MEKKIDKSLWLEFLPETKEIRSCTSICLKVKSNIIESYGEDNLKEKMNILFNFLEKEKIAFDINSYRDAPLGIRIWGGATINCKDIEILLDWLEWGYHEIITKEKQK